MARFHRSGHYRTNSNGATFWVSGHSVDRDAWGYTSSGYSTGRTDQATDLFGVAKTRRNLNTNGTVPSFTVPNARCPECGALVFFYQNSAGSRVFFDDLGPPWPKHPCTDLPVLSGSNSKFAAASKKPQSLATVPQNELDDLFSILLVPEEIPEDTAREMSELTQDGWQRCVVKKKTIRDISSDNNARIFYVAVSALDPASKPIRLSTPWRVPHPYVGDVVYLKENLLSFFDYEIFAPRNVEIERKIMKINRAAQRRTRNRKAKRKKGL